MSKVSAEAKILAERLVADGHQDILLADGFERAFIGLGYRCGQPPIAVYDRDESIKVLMKDMTEEEAEEYFAFNVVGAWVGEGTPLFLERLKGDKE